jgi:hypothetical protein
MLQAGRSRARDPTRPFHFIDLPNTSGPNRPLGLLRSNRNEYQRVWGVERGRYIRLADDLTTIYQPIVYTVGSSISHNIICLPRSLTSQETQESSACYGESFVLLLVNARLICNLHFKPPKSFKLQNLLYATVYLHHSFRQALAIFRCLCNWS